MSRSQIVKDFALYAKPETAFEDVLPGGFKFRSYSTRNNITDPRFKHEFQDDSFYSSGNIGDTKKVEDFFRDTVKNLHEKNKSDPDLDESGSTICGFIYDKKSKKITVGNLGDSKAYAILKSKSGKRVLVSLSEDFRAGTTRFRKHIEANVDKEGNQGKVIEPHPGYFRIEYGPGMAGAFGDNRNGDILVRKPDVFTFSTAEIIDCIKKSDAEFKDEEFEVSSFFVASDGFSDVENSFLKNSEPFKRRLFDGLYGLELDEKTNQRNFYRAVRNVSDKAVISKIHSELMTMSDYSDKLTIRKMRIDRKTAKVTDDELCLPAHLVSMARQLGSDDDISIIQYDLEELRQEIDEEHSQIFGVIGDAHGAKGEKVAKLVTFAFKESFQQRCEEVKKQQPSASPAEASAATAQMEDLSITQPDA